MRNITPRKPAGVVREKVEGGDLMLILFRYIVIVL